MGSPVQIEQEDGRLQVHIPAKLRQGLIRMAVPTLFAIVIALVPVFNGAPPWMAAGWAGAVGSVMAVWWGIGFVRHHLTGWSLELTPGNLTLITRRRRTIETERHGLRPSSRAVRMQSGRTARSARSEKSHWIEIDVQDGAVQFAYSLSTAEEIAVVDRINTFLESSSSEFSRGTTKKPG